MTPDQLAIVAVAALLFVPPLIYYRQKVYNRKREFVSSQCPKCAAFQDIKGVQNYTCKSCGEKVDYLDAQDRILKSRVVYQCGHCGQENIKGIVTCVACGMTNKDGSLF